MAHVYIFAEQIRALVRDGKKEIEIPAGARISAAAYDLIRENKLRIVKTKIPLAAPERKRPAGEKKPTGIEESLTTAKPPGTGESSGNSPQGDTADISAEALEDIVDRVIERFKEIKGIETRTADGADGSGIKADADEARDDDLVICRCEEITRAEIKDAIKNGMQTLNGIKRITRAGMGLCQGQTCQRLVAQILSEELGFSAAEIDPTTARGPVRPLPLKVFANS